MTPKLIAKTLDAASFEGTLDVNSVRGKGWEIKPFENCIEKVIYTAKIQRKDFLNSGEFPIVSQEESFINGYWNNGADVFSVSTPIIIFGDHTKVLKYVDFDFVLGADGVKVLAPKGFLLPKFFHYQLQSVNLDSLGYARHYKLLRELDIRYPPLPEQQRIVALLDEAFDNIATARANAEANLKNARAIFESHLESVFLSNCSGWLNMSVKECFKVRSGDFLPTKNMVAGEIPVYGGNGIAGFHNVENLSGDQVVIGRVGAKCGNVRYVTDDMWLTDNAFHISQYLRPFHPAFLTRLLNFKNLRQTANQAAQPVISYTTIKDVVLSFPAQIDEQVAINSKFDELEEETQRLESLYQRKLAALDELKKSLLHQAFTGEL